MKIKYDPVADAMYIYFCETGKKVADTVTIKPGVHADFDKYGELLGIEILNASKLTDKKIEVVLPESTGE